MGLQNKAGSKLGTLLNKNVSNVPRDPLALNITGEPGTRTILGVEGDADSARALTSNPDTVDPGAGSSCEQDSFDFTRAVKSDDAATPTFLWDDHIWSLGYHDEDRRVMFNQRYVQSEVLMSIRHWLLRRWRRNVWQSLRRYMHTSFGTAWRHKAPIEEIRVGQDALRQCAAANWWEWCEGSTLFYWRWPKYVKELVLEGHQPWFELSLPQYKVPQRWESDPDTRAKIKAKLATPLGRRYIEAGKVKSLTSYFSVPKGDSNLRIVYDASKSGLNSGCLPFSRPRVIISLIC
jgi:hypothetical protein